MIIIEEAMTYMEIVHVVNAFTNISDHFACLVWLMHYSNHSVKANFSHILRERK